MIEKEVFTDKDLDELSFSDIYFTPEKVAYIQNKESRWGLKAIETPDLKEFYKTLQSGFTKNSSYSICYKKSLYRVERVKTVTGVHYSARRMPEKTPDLKGLGYPEYLIKYLLSLNNTSGLILIGGPTGMGKTTTASSLLKSYLEMEGGFAYTIEDPPEMPLDGIYRAKNKGLGLCKQTEPIESDWGGSLRSALRSRPRYILVGEIRTPETAAQVLRAAISGHLVISTVHANSIEDSINSIVKYAIASGLNEELAFDLLSRGILGVLFQRLQGIKVLHPEVFFAFANPNTMQADQMRLIIRDGQLNLGTLIEAQQEKMLQGKPLFKTY